MGKRRFESVEGANSKFWEKGPEDDATTAPTGASSHVLLYDAAGRPVQAASPAPSVRASKPRRSAPGKKKVAKEIEELEPVLQGSVRPYVKIVASKGRGLAPWASKGNDRPYLPKGTPWPEVGGQRLYPVVQIDFADVPPLDGFPRAGLMSLFWSEDYDAFRILYFPTIVKDASLLQSDFPAIAWDDLYPFRGPVALSFEPKTGCVAWGDYRFKQIVGEDTEDALWDSPRHEQIWNHIWKWSGADDDHLGGYASPEQEDPRGRSTNGAYETVLLELRNDNFKHSFFIKPAALSRCDFSDLLYHCACD